jgi:signal transduction histidine kinase
MSKAKEMDAVLEANRRLEETLKAHTRITNRALADYQAQVVQLELVRQRTEDLELLASALGSAKRAAERRALDSEARARLHGALLRTIAQELEQLLSGRLHLCPSTCGPDLDDARDGARLLRLLLKDVVRPSNAEGAPAVPPTVTDVRSAVDECIAIARGVLGSRAIRVAIELDPDVGGISTDAVGFRQLLVALLCGAGDPSGTAEIELSLAARGDALVLNVSEPAALRRSARKRISSVIVRQLVRFLGGSVVLTDGPANLVVTLPGAIGAARQCHGTDDSGPAGSSNENPETQLAVSRFGTM